MEKSCPACKENSNDTLKLNGDTFGKCNNSDCRVNLYLIK